MPANTLVQSASAESFSDDLPISTSLARKKLLAFCGWHFPSKLRAFGEAMKLSEHQGQEIALLKYLTERHDGWDWNLVSGESEEWWEDDENLAAIQQDYPIIGGGLLRVADILFVEGPVDESRLKSTKATLATTHPTENSLVTTIGYNIIELFNKEREQREEFELIYDSLMLSKTEYKNRQFAEIVDKLLLQQAEMRDRIISEQDKINEESIGQTIPDDVSDSSSIKKRPVIELEDSPQPEPIPEQNVTNMEDPVIDMAAEQQLLSVARQRQRQLWHFERNLPRRVFIAPEEVCQADLYESDEDKSEVTYAGGCNKINKPPPLIKVPTKSPAPDELFPIRSPSRQHQQQQQQQHQYHHQMCSDDYSVASNETEELMNEIILLKSSVAQEHSRSVHLRRLEKEIFIKKTNAIRNALKTQIHHNNLVENAMGVAVQREPNTTPTHITPSKQVIRVPRVNLDSRQSVIPPTLSQQDFPLEMKPVPGFEMKTSEISKQTLFKKLTSVKKKKSDKASFRRDCHGNPAIPRTVSFQELFKAVSHGNNSKYTSPGRSPLSHSLPNSNIIPHRGNVLFPSPQKSLSPVRRKSSISEVRGRQQQVVFMEKAPSQNIDLPRPKSTTRRSPSQRVASLSL